MKKQKNGRGFESIVGKTISWVNTTAINLVTIHFTDGTSAEVDCDDTHLGIGILQLRKTLTKTVQVAIISK